MRLACLLLELVGLAAVVAGVALIYPPAAFIAAGIMAVVAGVISEPAD